MADEDRWVELSAGDEFAGYGIERTLGRGGMGVLYLAIEPGLERRVALKLIAPEAAADEVFARRFAEESKIAASIEHPNVVPIYAAGEQRGVPYIAMRYVSGSDLGARLRREKRLEPAVAAALIAQVGNGLDAIHAAGLVHRDVKPANVLLSGATDDEHAYITDFGVARNVATESGLTQTGRFVGTLDYVAPEQISGGQVDARADVYALGCLLFKLLTGEVPYPRDSEAARLYAHLNEPPPAPSLHADGVPMALDDVVVRAMSKSPEDRHLSAGDLGRAAIAALRDERPAAPERTVATGAAATKTTETIAVEPRGENGGDDDTAREDGATADALKAEPDPTTRRLQREAPVRSVHGRTPRWLRGRRGAMVAGGLLAVAAILAAALALGGGSENELATTTGAGSTAAKAAGPKAGNGEGASRAQPTTLTRSQLINRADEICEDSRNTYRRVRDAELERVPDVAYARELVAISDRAVPRFNALDPPAGLREAYGEYVEAQERVGAYDRQALTAAEEGDAEAYLRAREKRDEEAAERYRLAREIGFESCSASSG